jgi:CO/xanthine dehydrogenase Mo-binding subunit
VDKVTGRAQFGADVNLPGMLYGKVLRSPHAHARIRNVDVSGALAIPGVYAAVCGSDFPGAQSGEIGGEGGGDVADVAKNVMARDKALYHGHAVAAVAATSPALAEEALAAIEVDYEPLPAVLELDAAMASDAPLLNEKLFTKNLPEPSDKPSNIAETMVLARGDIDDGFARADVVVEGEYRIRRGPGHGLVFNSGSLCRTHSDRDHPRHERGGSEVRCHRDRRGVRR